MKWAYTRKRDEPLNYNCDGGIRPQFTQRSLLTEFVEAGAVSKADVVHFNDLPSNVPYIFSVTYRCHVGYVGHSNVKNPISLHDFLVEHFMWVSDNARLITDMREGRALLVIADHWEAHESLSDFVEGFAAFARTLKVPAKSIMFMDDNVVSHKLRTPDSIRYGTAHFFEATSYHFVRPFVAQVGLAALVHPTSKQKRFLSYNRHWNSYRQFAALEYVTRGLSAHGLISCSTCVDDEDRIHDALILHESLHTWTAEPDKYTRDDLSRFSNLLPMTIDTHLRDNLAASFKLDHYMMTDFSVVNETWADSARVFISEKLYKAIFAKHPFILFGNPGTLKYLRDCGYRTFPFMFDESYDCIVDMRQRKDVIIESIAKWCALPTNKRREFLHAASFVTQHNFDLLASRCDVLFQSAVDQIHAALTENMLTLGRVNT